MSLLLDVALFIRKNVKVLNLSMAERIVMMALAGRIGNNKSTWITQKTLAEECNISVRYLIEVLNSLIERQIIKIEKHGRKNHYAFTIEQVNCSSSIEDNMSTQQVHSNAPIPCTKKEYVNPSSPYRCTAVHLLSEKNTEIPFINQELTSDPPPPKYTIKATIKDKIKDIVHFDQFWNSYPRKESKKKAQEIWARNNLDENAQEIIEHLELRKRIQWGSREMRFIPLAATFLNQERWNDELETIGYEDNRTFSQLNPQQLAYKRVMDGVWGIQ